MADRLIDVLAETGATAADPDSMVSAFADWAERRGTALYAHQEEAILELYTGANVILATPTGSGKSLVALAIHAASVTGGGRSWYTAPVKALVSEKFFDLCDQFGAEHVGLLTGDSAVNPDAPIICCTTEVLALAALRQGDRLDAATVILDEFHYYGEPDRGWAWQTPLISLPQSQFLLMSATLGDVSFFRRDLTERTGRPTALVDRAVRPVPLTYEWRNTTLHRTVEDLLEAGQDPLYLVNFSQAEAVEVATAMASLVKLDPNNKAIVAAELAGARLASGFGKDLGRLLRNGVGVHHAGMLPRYRRLVERLAQRGALRVISGTDTLGIGVNLPIRTVVLTRLYKYDGSGTGLLGARAFHQVAGRAGRAGYDTAGLVVAVAPDHVAENLANAARAAADPSKKRKLHKVAPPKGFVHYDEATFQRLQAAPPEPLRSSFQMTPGMLMHLLDRHPDDPQQQFRDVRDVLLHNHEPRARQRRLVRNTIKLYKGLRAAGALDDPNIALDQLLAPFLLHTLPAVRAANDGGDGYAFAVLALVESVCDNPTPVLMAQRDKARDAAMAEMKAAGVEYEERIARLEKINYPQPLRDDIYELFDAWRGGQPWIGQRNIAPKGVVRDMWDRALDFPAYVRHLGVKRAEGVLLRYLSDVFKTLTRSVPADAFDDQLSEIATWLGSVITTTDSSLLDEWQALLDRSGADTADMPVVVDVPPAAAAVPDDETALRTLLRNRLFRWVQFAATARWDEWATDVAEVGDARWSAARLADATAVVAGEIGIGADARRNDLYELRVTGDAWIARQRAVVDGATSEWVLQATVDPTASRQSGELVARLDGWLS